MDFNEYQEKAAESAIYREKMKTALDKIWYPTLGLVGESGEVANKIKKIGRDGDGTVLDMPGFRNVIRDELGDILWYVSQLGKEFNLTMEEIAQCNIDKLKDRMERNKIQGSGDNR